MVRKSNTEPLSNIDCFPKRWLIGWCFSWTSGFGELEGELLAVPQGDIAKCN